MISNQKKSMIPNASEQRASNFIIKNKVHTPFSQADMLKTFKQDNGKL